MKYLVNVFALFLLSACGGDSPYTWGDAYYTVADEFCHFASECHYFESEDAKKAWRDDCLDHSVYHECELGDSVCDVSLSDGAEGVVDTCVEAMHQPEYASNCFYAIYGIIPEECSPVWDLKPDPEE